MPQPMTQPNQRLIRTAWILEKQTAMLVSHALEHIQLELSTVDGYGTAGDGTGRSSGDASSVERAGAIRHELTGSREQIRKDIDTLVQSVDDFDGFLRKTLGNRVPRHIPDLCNGQKYEGWLNLWRSGSKDEANGWADATCRGIAGPSGLCLRCLPRANRWRERNGLPPIIGSEVVS